MRWLVLALVGAVTCTFGDHLHATHGVLAYPHVDFWAQPFWVAPMFAGVAIAAVVGARPCVALATRSGPLPRPRARLIADGIGFVAAYAYTSFAPFDRPNVTLAVLVIAFAVRVLGEQRPLELVAYSLGLALIGCLGESALSATGAFHYLYPDAIAVPRWLPGIYLHGGLATFEISALFRGRA